MSQLQLELVVGILQAIEWDPVHLTLLDSFACLMTEATLCEDEDKVFVLEPFADLFRSLAVWINESVA